MLVALGHDYPKQKTRVQGWPSDIATLYPKPPGPLEDDWPPTQLKYLSAYLTKLGCKAILIEEHYIDRDYIHDVALYYARSLRNYPNYCQRIHFFSEALDDTLWRELLSNAAGGAEKRKAATERLQACYLGFAVDRPLAAFPVGRTVLKTVGSDTEQGLKREFTCVRDYKVHLAGFELTVRGLAFQQQDRGVSACATTALWSALNFVAPTEQLPAATPAEITQAASRYFLNETGRPLPSEGLEIVQMCEAVRAAGLSPLVIQGGESIEDKAQILGYCRSGLPCVLAIGPSTGATHAVCTVGLKTGAVLPPTGSPAHFQDAGTSLKGLYIHDDRLGPYASAGLYDWTEAQPGGPPRLRTGIEIRWPDGTTDEGAWLLHALIVPVPIKLRLTIARMRTLGFSVAEWAALSMTKIGAQIQLDCRYRLATDYRASAFSFNLSEAGLYRLNCDLVLSRYIGAIEISKAGAPLFDVILDTTENIPHQAILGCVRREALPGPQVHLVEALARAFETTAVV